MSLVALIHALRSDAARVASESKERPTKPRTPGHRRYHQPLSTDMLEEHNGDKPIRAGHRCLLEEMGVDSQFGD